MIVTPATIVSRKIRRKLRECSTGPPLNRSGGSTNWGKAGLISAETAPCEHPDVRRDIQMLYIFALLFLVALPILPRHVCVWAAPRMKFRGQYTWGLTFCAPVRGVAPQWVSGDDAPIRRLAGGNQVISFFFRVGVLFQRRVWQSLSGAKWVLRLERLRKRREMQRVGGARFRHC